MSVQMDVRFGHVLMMDVMTLLLGVSQRMNVEVIVALVVRFVVVASVAQREIVCGEENF